MTHSAPSHSTMTADPGDRDIQLLGRLVEQHSGLVFPANRRSELDRGVRQAFAASSCRSFDQYVQLLQDPISGPPFLEQLTNSVTIGETHFFRNAGQIKALSEHILPEIIAQRRALRTLRIWSAGCATGEEPYSLAIIVRELLPDIDDWSVTILATDINTHVLERARAGVYTEWSFREELARQLRPVYFTRHGNRFELHPDIRRLVTFAPLNLANGDYPSYATSTMHLDLIVCCNVMIYFSADGMRRTIARFHSALSDGGWLSVGHAEHSLDMFTQFRSRSYPGATFYQRANEHGAVERWPQPPHHGSNGWQSPVTPLPIVPQSVLAPPAPFIVAAPPASKPSPAPAAPASPLERAREMLRFGHSEQARDLLLACASDPGSPQAELSLMLGKAYANLGDWPNAEHYCRRARERDRLSADAYYTLALVMQHQGRISEAIHALKTVVYIDRGHVLGHFGLAELYDRSGEQALAVKSLRNVTRLLAGYGDADPAPGCPELPVGRLRRAVESQQQRLSAVPQGDDARRRLAADENTP